MEKNEDNNLENLEELTKEQNFTCFLIYILGSIIFSLIVSSVFSLSSLKTLSKIKINILSNFIIYALLLISLTIFLWNKYLRFFIQKHETWKKFLHGIGYGLVLIFGTFVISYISQILAQILNIDLTINENESNIREYTTNSPILMGITTIFFAPIVEEFSYRLGLFGGFKKINRFLGYAITILAFALAHFTFDSKKILIELFNLPSYIFAGLWLCFTYENENSIAASIGAHMTNNVLAFLTTMVG